MALGQEGFKIMDKKDLVGHGVSFYGLSRVEEICGQADKADQTLLEGTRLMAEINAQAIRRNDPVISPVVVMKIERLPLLERLIPLTPGQYVLGRSYETDIQSGFDPCISRIHMMVNIHHDLRVTVRDLSSTNGTFHNGWALSKDESVDLIDDDKLRVGESTISIYHVLQLPPPTVNLGPCP